MKPVRILHLEDNLIDAELIALQLASEHLDCRIQCVATEKEFSEALDGAGFDLILADHSGPTFDGHIALQLARKKNCQAPFIFVSGAGDSKETARAMENGAAGYILKHHLSELVPCILKSLR